MGLDDNLKIKDLYYLPPIGGRYKGNLKITRTAFLFEADFDETFQIINRNHMIIKDQKKILSINKEDVSSVEFRGRFLKNKLILSIAGKPHIFTGFLIPKNKVFNAFKITE